MFKMKGQKYLGRALSRIIKGKTTGPNPNRTQETPAYGVVGYLLLELFFLNKKKGSGLRLVLDVTGPSPVTMFRAIIIGSVEGGGQL